MKAIVCTRYGPPEVLQLKEVEKPTPKANELLIRIHATTVTFGDVRIRSFTWPLWFRLPGRVMYGLTKPRKDIPGNELAGTVEVVGLSSKKRLYSALVLYSMATTSEPSELLQRMAT